MREILFRGKPDKGEWVYGHYVYQYGAHMIYLPDVTDIEYGFDYHHIIPETVGQYTGLTDKNGTKIFEGDILEYQIHFKDGSKKPFRAEVKAETMSFGAYHKVYGFCAYLEFGDMENSEIIGNIHDNPELLKGGVQE